MDKASVKLLLDSYRPKDASDPIFAEALAEVARDPELAAWFEEVQGFDAAMSAKLRDFPVPEEVRTLVLAGTRPRERSWQTPRWGGWLAAAAVVVLAAMLGWKALAPSRPREALALQAISFTNEMPALQFVCFDAAAVAGWVNEQPGAQKMGLTLPKPGSSANMAMIGSSVVDWKGRAVIMIALQNGPRMAMLYLLNPDETENLGEGASETFEQDGWVVRTSRKDGKLRLLTTKGEQKDLEFQMPF